MSTIGRIVNYIVLALGLAMIGYYLALGIRVRFGQSLQFLWLLGGLFCVARFAFWAWADHAGRLPSQGPLLLGLRVIVLAAAAVFLLGEALILSGGMMAPQQDLDCIIVLGAKVNGREPSGALRNRIAVAAEYMHANPDTVAILTGGKGSDEEISEAQCMYENITAAGIDPARLILEDHATDTQENMRFSRELIPEGCESIGIVTNNFHMFRSLATARKSGIADPQGVPVATSAISMPHYLMREFCGVLFDSLKGNLAF